MATKHTASIDDLLRNTTVETVNGFGEAAAVLVTLPQAGSHSESNRDAASLSKGPWLKANRKRALEVVVLSSIILLVCGLFTIPTIFYALPSLQVQVMCQMIIIVALVMT